MSRRTRPLETTKVKRRKRIVTYITVEREIVSVGPVYSAFAEIVRMQRGEAGMTQEDMAKAMGMSRPSLANIEAGRQRVLLGDVFEFARVLKIKPENLFAMLAAEINT
jgi:DNA-binding XRE family transcriptional regulator